MSKGALILGALICVLCMNAVAGWVCDGARMGSVAVEVDPFFVATGALQTDLAGISNKADTAYGWGDHGEGGYPQAADVLSWEPDYGFYQNPRSVGDGLFSDGLHWYYRRSGPRPAPGNQMQVVMNYKFWDDGNDGTNSGLDADMLDGQHASEFEAAGAVATHTSDTDAHHVKTVDTDTHLTVEQVRAAQTNDGYEANFAYVSIGGLAIYDADGSNLHFEVSYSTSADFSGVVVTNTMQSQDNWFYFNGSIYAAFPSGGLTAIQQDATLGAVLYQVPLAIASTGIYVRARASDGVDWGDYVTSFGYGSVTVGRGSLVDIKRTVIAKSDDYSVTLTDSSRTFVMTAVGKTISLPSVAAADIGTWYTFVKDNAGTLTIDAADSDTIADSGAGDTIYDSEASETYATITLQLIGETKWVITGAHGTWITTDI